MSELIRCERHQGVAHITLNRPEKLNALSAEMLTQLLEKMRELDGDKQIRTMVISGSARAFAAGADTGTLATASAIALYTSGFSEKWDQIAAIEKPVIAALSGYALGGGLELALLCDIVIADDTTVIGLPETHIGIIPGAGGRSGWSGLWGNHWRWKSSSPGEKSAPPKRWLPGWSAASPHLKH